MDLHDTRGQRLYLTAAERAAFLAAATQAPLPVRTFSLVLHYTGCRISEALALTPASIDLSGKTIVFETLKKRRRGIYRAVPVPAGVARYPEHGPRPPGGRKTPQKGEGSNAAVELEPDHGLAAGERDPGDAAAIAEGPHKSPEGLRHGYGVQAVSSGVPPNMLKKWMGHASLAVTAIYSDALGEEQHRIAARMWE